MLGTKQWLNQCSPDPESLIFQHLIQNPKVLCNPHTWRLNSLACLWCPPQSDLAQCPCFRPGASIWPRWGTASGAFLLLILCSLCFFYLQHPFPKYILPALQEATQCHHLLGDLFLIPPAGSSSFVRREHSFVLSFPLWKFLSFKYTLS